jgi:hypothetical protein
MIPCPVLFIFILFVFSYPSLRLDCYTAAVIDQEATNSKTTQQVTTTFIPVSCDNVSDVTPLCERPAITHNLTTEQTFGNNVY